MAVQDSKPLHLAKAQERLTTHGEGHAAEARAGPAHCESPRHDRGPGSDPGPDSDALTATPGIDARAHAWRKADAFQPPALLKLPN